MNTISVVICYLDLNLDRKGLTSIEIQKHGGHTWPSNTKEQKWAGEFKSGRESEKKMKQKPCPVRPVSVTIQDSIESWTQWLTVNKKERKKETMVIASNFGIFINWVELHTYQNYNCIEHPGRKFIEYHSYINYHQRYWRSTQHYII